MSLAPGQYGRGEALRGAVCAELPPSTADRYLRASRVREPFAHSTGMMLCQGCPVRVACLAQAIVEPITDDVIRGGLPGHVVAALAWQARRERVPAERLARQAIARAVPPLRGAHGREAQRAGRMPDHVPLYR